MVTVSPVVEGNPTTSGSADPRGTVLGIDVGGTKTHLVEARGDQIIGESVVATTTWRTPWAKRNAEALQQLVEDHLGRAAVNRGLVIGTHGCDSTAQCLELEAELAPRFPAGVRVLNDAELMPLAMGVTPGAGIGLVSGTGSIAVARSDADELLTSGGWGWVLGDEGSAAGIVREACRAVLSDHDRGTGADALTARMMAAFGVEDVAELAMAVTRANSASVWGSHAREVFAAADEGAQSAVRVIEQAGSQLAVLVDQLVNRGVRAESVVAGGAVITAQARLRDAFTSALTTAHPELVVTILDRAPVMGAVALANRLYAQPHGTAINAATFSPEVTS